MINLFDKIYSIRDKNSILINLRIYSIIRYLTRTLANFFLPIYFNLSNLFFDFSIKSRNNESKLIIISLTSFPQRINKVWLVIESLLRQRCKPDKIILWLSLKQFKDLNSLPVKLLELQKRGLEIRLCEDDLRSHKKYYYSMQEFPSDIIITVDDDVIYNTKLICNLIEDHNKFPSSIICNKGKELGIKDDKITPYINWSVINKQYGPSMEIMPIGIGGVLYPPNCLHKDAFKVELFKKLCFYADDIWLNFMSRKNGTSVVKTYYNSNYLPVINKNNVALSEINVRNGLNDKQFADLSNYCLDHSN